MLYLSTNTASQTLRLSLNEGRLFVAAFTKYLFEIRSKTGEVYYFIADVDSENDRYTTITVGTNSDDGVNSKVLIIETGQYIYTVYGQNSDTNLDPEDAAVVGIVERGQMKLSGTTTFVTESTTVVPPIETIAES